MSGSRRFCCDARLPLPAVRLPPGHGMDSSATTRLPRSKRATTPWSTARPRAPSPFAGQRLRRSSAPERRYLLFPSSTVLSSTARRGHLRQHKEGSDVRSAAHWLRRRWQCAAGRQARRRMQAPVRRGRGDRRAGCAGRLDALVVEGRWHHRRHGDGRSVRVAASGGHTTIGEMGLITGHPRSAHCPGRNTVGRL